MSADQQTTRAKAEWDADRAYIHGIDPDYDMPAWGRAPAWQRRPYLIDPDKMRAVREVVQRGETLEVADE